MAKISRNSFSRGKNRTKVIEQIGIPVVDADFNEAQDILSVMNAEAAMACFSSIRAAATAGVNQGYAVNDDFKPYASGTATVFITKGTLFVDGYQLTLDTDLDLTTVGVTFAAPGAQVYGLVYLDVVFAERDSVADTSITIPLIGETAIRQVLSTTWRVSEGATLAAAYAGVAAFAPAAGATMWKNGTARVYLGRYTRTTTAVIAAANVVDMRSSVATELVTKLPFVKFHKAADTLAAEGNGHNDGYVIWDASNGRLSIGNRDVTADSDELLGAMSISMPLAPRQRISQESAQEWLRLGAGTANGSPIQYQAATGLALPDGSAVGFLAGTLATTQRTKQSGVTDLYGVSPAPATLPLVQAEGLTVQTLATFGSSAAPGTFVLCLRVGNDLIWWNGHVTRGNLTQPVLDDPTAAMPGTHQVIVGKHGSVHGSAAWALETAFNTLATGFGANTLGYGRVMKALVQRGAQEFTRYLTKYGDGTETTLNQNYDINNNVITIDGDGAMVTKLTTNSVDTSLRSPTNLADLELRAARVVLRGFTMKGNVAGASAAASYLMKIDAAEVIIEDCHFWGGLLINANKLRIRNCTFDPQVSEEAASTPSGVFWPGSTTVAGLGAQALYLAGPSTLPSKNTNAGAVVTITAIECTSRIEDCQFHVGATVLGYHGAVILNQSEVAQASMQDFIPARTVIKNCSFRYLSATTTIPSIDVRTKTGSISIEDCSFQDAPGVAKNGSSSGTGLQTANDYGGSVLTLNNGNVMGAGYVTCLAGRADRSKLDVVRCNFHMGAVGINPGGTQAFRVWGAFVGVCNVLSVGGGTQARYRNITFADNSVQMFLDGLGATPGAWASLTAKDQPVIHGFLMSPDVANAQGFLDVSFEDIVVKDNYFDIGGHTAAAYAWRSIAGLLGDGSMYHTSAPIHFSLFNTTISGSAAQTGRRYYGIRIQGNRILQRPVSGGGALVSGLFTVSKGSLNGSLNAANGFWAFVGIIVTPEAPVTPRNFANTTGVNPEAANSTWAGDVKDNEIVCFYATPTYSSGSWTPFYVGILLDWTRCRVDGNWISLPQITGAVAISSLAAHGSGNTLQANTGWMVRVGHTAETTLTPTARIEGNTFLSAAPYGTLSGTSDTPLQIPLSASSGNNFIS